MLGGMERRGYPSDVSDEEWALVAPYVTLMTESGPPSGGTPYARSLMGCAGWYGRGRRGGCYRMTCRPGRWSINKRNGG